MRPLTVVVSLFLGLITSIGPSFAASLQLEALPGAAWEGPQFVAADRRGQVQFLRARTLTVYPLTKAGLLGQPVALETTGGAGGETYDAVLSPGGDVWLLRGPRGVRLFVAGKEKPVPPLAWAPVAVGFLRDTPLVAVTPLPLAPKTDSSRIGTLPWLQRLDGERWTTWVERKGVTFADLVRKENWVGEVSEKDPVTLATDHQGGLWEARRYAYRVRQLSPTGRSLLEILVDQGKIRKKEESRGVEVKRSDPAGIPTEATRNPTEKGTFFTFTASAVIQDMAEGLDGRMYFLTVLEDGGAALDRYEPSSSSLERVRLSLKARGSFTLAAGQDALYFAGFDGKDGRWRLSWETLEQAPWRGVAGAEVDGARVKVAGR